MPGRINKRRYSAEDYFEYLYFLLFGNKKKWYDVCTFLNSIDFNWQVRMDENREYDGYEIRKYYLSDEHGYLPDDIDIYDEIVFPKNVSVFEMLVGFLNRLCRDVFDDYKIGTLGLLIFSNLGLRPDDTFEDVKQKWDFGMRNFIIFGPDVPKVGFWDKSCEDLWSQAMIWWNL